jgi:predicted RNA binding protein YcfA (HicA-like mRNA interferase family)
MKLPRDIGGKDLADLLSTYGYQITRQTGSHLRLRSSAGEGVHSLTIPAHRPLKVGTLSAVLSDIAKHLEIDKQELIGRLFEEQD